jgi:putative PEP-CTERM system histidine kinase
MNFQSATLAYWSYGLAAAAYLVFAVRVALGARGAPAARRLLVALVVMSAWAATSMPLAASPSTAAILLASSLDSLRSGAWFLFLWHLVPQSPVRGPGKGSLRSGLHVPVVLAILVGAVLLGEGAGSVGVAGIDAPRIGFVLRIGVAVYGLILVEQLIRGTSSSRRWAIKPLALALAALFGLELLFFSDALSYGHFDPDIWIARAFASVVVIPFLAIATARNTDWTVNLHVSRGAVFHSSALLASGAFLILVAGAGYFVRYAGGSWGRALQIELMFAAAVVLGLVGTSGRFRARLRVFISKHFFSYRYDYREEWLRFTRTLADEDNLQEFRERTVMALADLVESPGGMLWISDDLRAYVPAARWNMPAVEAIEPLNGALADFLKRTGWIVDLPEVRRSPDDYAGLVLPSWCQNLSSAWLVIPLIGRSELVGFVVLASPRAAVEVDWEVRDLLKTASRQAASYLEQMKSAEALLEAHKFESFNRMSAFVVHDLKNLVAQLSLMLSNAQRHKDNPAFQADMLETVRHVVDRMNALMLQLRSGSAPLGTLTGVDVAALVRQVCDAKCDPRVQVHVRSVQGAMAVGHESRLEHVIGHLLQNAIDASPDGSTVTVIVDKAPDAVSVTICDRGIGMTPEFLQHRLFRPFESTKPSGMGIGVYESAHYLKSIGGAIAVDSSPEAGTTVRVVLPARDVHQLDESGASRAARIAT